MYRTGFLIILSFSGLLYGFTKPLAPATLTSLDYPTINGQSCAAASQSQLISCLNTLASLNDSLNHEIVIAGGWDATYFELPGRSDAATGWIVLRSANQANLPAYEPDKLSCRVNPTFASSMWKFQMDGRVGGGGHIGIGTADYAHHYWIDGVNIVGRPYATYQGSWMGIMLGRRLYDPTVMAIGAHHFMVTRSYIHGDDRGDIRSAIRIDTDGTNGAGQVVGGHVGVLCNHIDEIHEEGADTQAIIIIAARGPMLIQNNHLESAGENWMCGGAQAPSAELVPTDIIVRHNYIHKDPAWLTETGPQGSPWTRKTALETKDCNRVLIEANELHVWFGEGGHSLRLTPRNESGTAPWSEVSDLEISYNRFHGGPNWLNAFDSDDCNGRPPGCYSQTSKRWWIHDNLVYDLGNYLLGGESSGSVMTWASGGPGTGFTDFTFSHNTVLGTCERVWADNEGNHTNVDYSNNLIEWGCSGASYYRIYQDWEETPFFGTVQLDRSITNWIYASNTFFSYPGSPVGEDQSDYPATTIFDPADASTIGMLDPANGNFQLAEGSPYSASGTLPGSDGLARGVRWDLFDAAQIGGAGLPPPPNPCGNSICDAGETTATCPADCPAPSPNTCGNGVCDVGETNGNCASDCALPPPPPNNCGNGVCDSNETATSCAVDCVVTPPADGTANGDGTCTKDSTGSTRCEMNFDGSLGGCATTSGSSTVWLVLALVVSRSRLFKSVTTT